MKSNRMFGILCILLEREKIAAQELAEYFEVSVRSGNYRAKDVAGRYKGIFRAGQKEI